MKTLIESADFIGQPPAIGGKVIRDTRGELWIVGVMYATKDTPRQYSLVSLADGMLGDALTEQELIDLVNMQGASVRTAIKTCEGLFATLHDALEKA